MSSEQTDTVTMTHTAPLRAGQPFRMVFEITVGTDGIAVGGGFRIASPEEPCTGRWRQYRWDYQTVRVKASNPSAVVRSGICLVDDLREVVCVTVHGVPLVAGDRLTVVIGDLGPGTTEHFARAQKMPGDGLEWSVGVDASGAGEFTEIALFPVRVDPGPTAAVLARAPSVVELGQPFRIALKPEDEHGNVSGDLETVECRIDHEGVHRLEVSGVRANPTTTRKPYGRYNVYWGDLHGHCSAVPPDYPPGHGHGTPSQYYEFARDVSRLDFVALTEYAPGDHEFRQDVARRFYAPGKFVSFFGIEWGGSAPTLKGHVHIVYADDTGIPRPVRKTLPGDPRQLFASLREAGVRALVIPHHTNAFRDCGKDRNDTARELFGEFLDHARSLRIEEEGWGPWVWWEPAPEYMRLFEVHQMRGSFERDALGKGVLFGGYGASAQDALAKGLRLGFVGGTDTHLGRPGDKDALFCLGSRRRGGMTAVLAEELTREAIFEALYARRCYCTSSARIILETTVNGRPMGSELTVPANEDIEVSVTVNGTDRVETIEIVKNNVDVCCFEPVREDASVTWREQASEPAWYYVRITQRDGEMAWSSPVWVDLADEV